MAKLCSTGEYFSRLLKDKLPPGYFLQTGASSIKVLLSDRGQIKEELRRYDRILTFPLVYPTREMIEGKWGELYWFNSVKFLPKMNREYEVWTMVSREIPLEMMTPDQIAQQKRKGRLTEISGLLHRDLMSNPDVSMIHLGDGHYDVDLFREKRGLRKLDRVRLSFDVNYVNSLPEWALSKRRI